MSVQHFHGGGKTQPYRFQKVNFMSSAEPRVCVGRNYTSEILELHRGVEEGRFQNQSENEEFGRKKLFSRGHWRPHEDEKLRELVSQHGPQNWNLIAQNLKGRSGKSCRLRWFNQLDPRINKRPFSEEEEERLLAAHALHGSKWALISRLFKGRTDNAVKNHWHVIMARKHREANCVYRKRKPSSTAAALQNSALSNLSINSANHNKDKNIIDESGASSCTLTPTSSTKRPPFGTMLSSLSRNQFLPSSAIGCSTREERVVGMGSIVNGGSGKAAEIEDQTVHSGGSNSEVTASDSAVANNSPNLIINHENRTTLPFIDFLGVGPT